MKNVQFAQEEANALIKLMDIAVKAEGINVAQAALHLTNKIQEAFKEEPKTEEVKGNTPGKNSKLVSNKED